MMKRTIKKPVTATAAAAVLAAAMMLSGLPAGAFAQLNQPAPSRFNIIDANYSGPVFLDAFWTDRTSPPPAGTSLEKVEVAPGDGSSVLAVTLVNRGFSEITAVTGYLALPADFRVAGGGGGSTSSNSSSGSQVVVASYNNIVPAGGTFTLFFQVDITEKAQVRSYSAPLKVEFSRTLEVGTPRTADLEVPFKVTGRVALDASPGTSLRPGTSSAVKIEVINRGSAPATGVIVTVPGTSGINPATQQASIVGLGKKTFELGVIPPGGSATIELTLYAANSAGETLQTMNLSLAYGNAYGVRKSLAIPVGLVVLPESSTSALSVEPAGGSSTMITAGKITDLNVTLANTGDQQLSDVVVTVRPQSESIKILGNTSWNIGDMAANSSSDLATKVFASEDMIGRAATFVFTVQHLSAGGQPEIETFDLGSYVDGEISVRAYEIGVTYIGGKPNITGNLLNEGNVIALFTTVDLVSAEGLVTKLPPQQYLGDLSENSPLPFSIPVETGNARAGTYPVVLRVEYKDSLKQTHALDIKSEVAFEPEQTGAQAAANQQQAAGMQQLVIVGAIIAAAVIAAVVLIMRRRKGQLKRKLQYSKGNGGGGGDIESVLDSQMSGGSSGAAGGAGKPSEERRK